MTKPPDPRSRHPEPDDPRASFLIPVYNGKRFLSETLESVLGQTIAEWEAVIVDDASSDGSVALARSYAEQSAGRFHVHALERNVGVVGARNHALAHSSGPTLVLLDHDDILHADFLERMLELLEPADGRRVGIACCDATLLESGGVASETWGQRLGWYDTVTLDTLIERNTIFPRAAFRRAATDEVGGFDPATTGADDFDLWFRIVEAGWEVAVTRASLAAFRLHAGSLSNDRVAMNDSLLAVFGNALERGRLTPTQEQAVHRRIRHVRIGRALALIRNARRDGRKAEAMRRAVAVAPRAAAAVGDDWWHARRAARSRDDAR